MSLAGRVASIVVLTCVAGLASACGREASAPAAPDPAAAVASDGRPAVVAAETGMPETFENPLGMRFRLVPAGVFVEGDGPSGDPAARHEVNVFTSMYLQESEVTKGQWAAFTGAPAPADADAPATGVSHDDARKFVAWLAARDPRWAYRLPTEAEWDRAWLSGRERAVEGPVTPWGFRGMTTDPAEWCVDWFDVFPDWPVMSPRGPDAGTERVLRPGPPGRPAGRRALAPDRHDPAVGLRVAASMGYGGDDRGRWQVTFVTRDGRPGIPDGPEVSGYQIRVVAIIDRLTARQHGVHYTWAVLPGRSSPLTVKLIPGIYYAQCQHVVDGETKRGLEVKFGVQNDGVRVDLPIPKEGAYLQEPE